MKSLDKIAGLGIEMAEKDLTTVEGGKNYSKTWWYKSLTLLGKVAEGTSSAWHGLGKK
ncbi:bacteriocin [Lactiplantibacillus plantarum]